MRSNSISFAPKPPQTRPLVQPSGAQMWRGYYPVRKTLLTQGGKPVAAPPARSITTNIVNNLRMVNHITLRISLSPAKAQTKFAAEHGKTVSAIALDAIDTALRGEIDREVSLMRRGENLGANKRRRAMMNRYLLEKPKQVIRYFYRSRMQPIVNSTAFSAQDSFHSDIIRERQTQVTRTSYEQHNEKIIRQENSSTQGQTQTAQAIAEQVFNRIQRKLRLDRERSGWLR